tara:strand:- start:1427 stop:1825 length:399 start_codon:yes stop_codon:yes gene_type:complete
MKRAVTINFPAPIGAQITCPICEGNKCKVCDMSGKIEVNVGAKVPIQQHLIVKYVAEHIEDISSELGKHYGLVPEVQTEDMFNIGDKTYELVKISSLGGVVWVAHRVDELESPRYFKSLKNLNDWKGGMHDE